MHKVVNVSRRHFMGGTAAAAGALVLGVHIPAFDAGGALVDDGLGRINAYVNISADNTVTISLTHAEMGQGIHTALPMILAEELVADWTRIKVDKIPAKGGWKVLSAANGTGGSRSVRGQFYALAQAGAVARELLRRAAANRWNVPLSECVAENGRVQHYISGRTPGRSASYGDLAPGAARLDPPENVPLKDPRKWALLGKPVKRLDAREKITGKAVYGVDVQLPNMLVGTVMHCPVWGGVLESVEKNPALAVRGVRDVITTTDSIIVVGEGYWQAKKGLDALVPVWASGKGAASNTASVQQKLKQAAAADNPVVTDRGDIAAAISGAASVIEAEYEVPLLHQATMEPMNATAWVRRGKTEVWAPTQSAGRDRIVIARELEVPDKEVTIHVTFLGGGFGRRSSADFLRPAVIASKATGRPVKIIWSREEDMSHGLMRPPALSRMKAALNADGTVRGLDHDLIVPSISAQRSPERVHNGIDPVSVHGADRLNYAIPSYRLRYAMPDIGAPLGFWRSVPHSYNAFFVESFIDEVAAHTKRDPVTLRRQLLAGFPRHRAVLDAAVAHAGWTEQRAHGQAMGVALHESFGSIVAQVVALSVSEAKEIRLEHITAVVNCGVAINPLTIKAQIEGGIVYALSAAMYGRIDIAQGQAVQKNFDTYEMVRLDQMPPIDVHIIENGPIGGIGEPGVPPLAPALANAIFAATGDRVRSLPLADHGYSLIAHTSPQVTGMATQTGEGAQDTPPVTMQSDTVPQDMQDEAIAPGPTRADTDTGLQAAEGEAPKPKGDEAGAPQPRTFILD